MIKPMPLPRNVAPKERRTRVRRVSPVPFGLGFTKPHNYREVLRSAWNNKHAPFFAWRILRDGVCDGCALGTTGLRDFTMEGIHLCTVRLDLLPLNTMGPLRIRRLEDAKALRSKSSQELRELGRMRYPMIRHRGNRGFRRISWDDALQFAARQIRATSPDRLAFFITSRGMTNESYYVANKVARFLGTNHIDNSSRSCHSPSTTGLKDTTGFYPVRVEVASQTWEQLERQAGVSKDRMLDFARMYHEAKSAIFVWSMGITHHRFGVDNVKAIVNLGLARGIVGREKCGLMPIRGHSGVQGGSEMGAQPAAYGLGFPVDDESADRFAKLWGFRPPTMAGMTAVGMIDAAHERRLDVLYLAGGNFLETLPEPDYVRAALGRIPLRIHQDLVLTSQMLVDPAETVLLFPAQTRYEQRGGGTETSTERRVYFSPEIPGRRIGESPAEREVFMDLAQRAPPAPPPLLPLREAPPSRAGNPTATPTHQE